MTTSARVYYGAIINPVDLRHFDALPRALIGVTSDGEIAWLEKDVEDHQVQDLLAKHSWSDVELFALDKWDWLMPGFIDTHTHACQFPNIGIGQQYQLLDWLENVTFPTEAKFADTAYAKQIYPSVLTRLISNGTTTCCYYASLHLESTKILADIAHASGQRAYIGKCNMDRESPPTYIESSPEQSVADTEALIKYIRSLPTTLVHPIITPRFAISCTSLLLHQLGALAAKDPTVPIQTHISENLAEIAFTKSLFKDCETYADVYDSHGLLKHNTILAHAVHLEPREIELIKTRNAGISHCPTSNLNLSSGSVKVGEMLDKGIKVGLGTDCSGGFAASILTVVQHASIMSKVVSFEARGKVNSTASKSDSTFADKPLPVATLLYLATVGGARVCNLQDTVGSFEVGKSFDALRISLNPRTKNPGISAYEDPSGFKGADSEKLLRERLEKFLFCGDDRNIAEVWVAGRLIGGQNFSG
ncbi:guanine deaminase [Sistotremastrum niveocremeum HHB9708]|uniref:Guanine deaminase n=1 Tax=Sistotremastrum niveocremeum HHB9708 TaxID=1314777 RepID=A0A164S4E0_9AGAM|nr:guanine deaminase [Sistotremastrum niveocremeum HHB9708]